MPLVPHGKQSVAHRAHRPVGTHDPIFLRDDLAARCGFQARRGLLPVVRMDGLGPIAHAEFAGLPPDHLIGTAQVFEPTILRPQDPNDVGRIIGKLPEALFALADRVLGTLLIIDVLEDCDRPLDLASAAAERRRCDANPGFAPVRRGVNEIDPGRHGLPLQRPRAGIA